MNALLVESCRVPLVYCFSVSARILDVAVLLHRRLLHRMLPSRSEHRESCAAHGAGTRPLCRACAKGEHFFPYIWGLPQ